MNPDCAFLGTCLIALRSDLLEVDDEHLRIVLGVSEELGGVESEDVVGNSLGGFGKEVAGCKLDSTKRTKMTYALSIPRWL